MHTNLLCRLAFAASLLLTGLQQMGAAEAASSSIRHSYLVLGGHTSIIAEDGTVEWEHKGGSRDGFVLPGGNVLVTWSDRVEEVTRDKRVVFSYLKSKENGELSTAQRLYNGNTAIIEMGAKPRILEVGPDGAVRRQIPLDPETTNVHMQTRMARQLRNGNFLVPHLLAFAIKEYSPEGKVVRVFRTDLEEVGGRQGENWPFTAIRLDNGNTVSSLTHGNKVVEFNPRGEIVWKITNADVGGLFQDPCGSQRLANGNTVIGSHAANKGISMVEVTPDKQMVWTSDHPHAAGVHHFQILTTNGNPEPGVPQK